ncbi:MULTISPECIES: PspC domain-containing protein [Olivibacter]|jgi:phage shock protein PspC (stress-responsive transcriptional regulator)|uniref:PspC domain-containing protein n=1 Tax=Olivibacter jilunii TaxID=985016 RepID=A0ABW6BAC7_9SPHI|nr:PspC domain-containing protein [Olivibacter sp. UJ_SKK_5.1]MDX3912524.1 PspC domain-containing protein [Pseudosphingobacterium sp.]
MEKELRRNEQEGMLGGVCAGLGEYLGIDKAWIRVIFVLSIFFSAAGIGLIGPIAYVIMWIVVPRKPFVFPGFQEPYGRPHMEKTFTVGGEDVFHHLERRKQRERRSVGVALLLIGTFFLLLQLDFITWEELIKYWPLVFVVGGLISIFSSFKLGKGQAAEDPLIAQPKDKEKPEEGESEQPS